MKVSERSKKEKGAENLFKEITTEASQICRRNMQIHETQRTPNRLNVMFTKTHNQNLKNQRKDNFESRKRKVTYNIHRNFN